jgi:hypothetical protein
MISRWFLLLCRNAEGDLGDDDDGGPETESLHAQIL